MTPKYEGGVIFDKDGNKVTEFFEGDEEYHFANFLKAVRSRKVFRFRSTMPPGATSCPIPPAAEQRSQRAIAIIF